MMRECKIDVGVYGRIIDDYILLYYCSYSIVAFTAEVGGLLEGI